MKAAHRVILRSLAFVLIALHGVLPTATAYATAPDPAAESMQAAIGSETRVSIHSGTGKVRFMGTPRTRPIEQSLLTIGPVTPEVAARHFLQDYGTYFGLRDEAQELTVTRAKSVEDADGSARDVVRFQQLYKEVPVFGGELVVQLAGDNAVLSASGEILPAIELDVTPQIDSASAAETAIAAVAKWHDVDRAALVASAPTLWVYDPVLVSPYDGPTELVWRLEVRADSLLPINELILVNAQRGSIALHFNQIHTAMDRQTFDAAGTNSLPGTPVCDESDPTCSSGSAEAQIAHSNIGDAYTFYATQHGRDSVDNAGMSLISTINYCPNAGLCPYENAFWNGEQMVYGTGYAVGDDVVGHELTHGITQFESGLLYYYQSGAINESFSDIWGEFVDLTNSTGIDTPTVRWHMGEDLPIGAIRNMQDPTLHNHPDKMTSVLYYIVEAESPSGPFDNGGVHLNSGVNNKAAYLMTDGDTFNGFTVTALGIPKVAAIYYEAQTNLLTSGSDYADLYDLLFQACLNKVGSAGISEGDCQEVRDATDAVEMDGQPVAGFNTDAPLCDVAGEGPANLFFDDLEANVDAWLDSGIEGSSPWFYPGSGFFGPYAHSGSSSLYADDAVVLPSDSYVSLATPILLPPDAYLHFAHAYAFEYPNYDGAVLEYTINGGTSWLDAGALFDHNGYNGAISAVDGNPLAGRQAFINDSHGYISSRVDLSSLSGETANFRWRMGLDSVFFDRGWWIDDVRVYTCEPPATLTVTKSGTGTGSVASTPPGINCGVDCSEIFDGATQVTLTATADVTARFAGWTGDCTGTNACALSMIGDKNVDAQFDLCYLLTLSHTGNGADPVPSPANSPGCAAGRYVAGAVVDLTATPAAGSQVSSWSGTANNASTATVNSVTMPAGNHAAAAAYSLIPRTLTVNTVGSGTVTKDPDQPTYPHGTVVELTASPAANFTFSAWSGACSGTGACSVTMDNNKSVTATFSLMTYTLTANIVGGGTVSKDPDLPSYPHGTVVELTATPDSDHTFTGWSGACTGTSTCSVTMNSNKSVTATFTLKEYALTVNTVGSGTVTKDPDQPTYTHGTVVELTASPAVSFTFTGWSGACTGPGACSVTMDSSKGITATFTEDIAAINNAPVFTSTPELTSTVGTTYTYAIVAVDADAGDVLTLTAPSKPDWLTLAPVGDGTATLSGSAGAANIWANPVELRVEDAAGAFATQVFTITVVTATATGTVQGVVLDRDGNGVEDATVTLTSDEGEVTGAAVITEQTDNNGNYLFENVPVGAYTLRVSGEGVQPSGPMQITVTAGQTATVPTITLQPEQVQIHLPALGKE